MTLTTPKVMADKINIVFPSFVSASFSLFISDCIKIECFPLDPNAFLHRFAHFIILTLSALSYTDSLVFPDTLIDLLQNLKACYSSRSLRSCIFSKTKSPCAESLHETVNFPVAHTVFNILNFILQNASPCCSLVHCANKAAMLNLTQYYRYSRDSETQLGANERRFVLFVPVIFSVLPTSILLKFPVLFFTFNRRFDKF